MEFLLAVFFVGGVIIQIGNVIYWVLTKLHLTKEYRISEATIIKDLGYNEYLYLNSLYVRNKVTEEFMKRLRE